MSYYSLEQACSDFPALAAMVRGDYDALRQANPVVDRIQAAMNPFVLNKPERALSPAARQYPFVSDGLDRARTVALDTRERDEIRDRGLFVERQLEILGRGGEPVGLVVLHCREWTYDTDRAIPASIAYVVPVGQSRETVAREVAHSTWACWLCERGHSYNCESFLLVSCGAIVHVLSACRRCRRELSGDGLDWVDR